MTIPTDLRMSNVLEAPTGGTRFGVRVSRDCDVCRERSVAYSTLTPRQVLLLVF